VSLILTDEQEALRDSVKRFCAEVSPPERVRALMDSADGYDPDAWRRMATELGLCGLAVPEEHGGAGYGIAELAVAAEELGAALVPGPFWASAVLGALLLTELAGDSPEAAALLAEVADGRIVTVALDDGDGTEAAGDVLTGTKRPVTDAVAADRILVVARLDGAPAVFDVAAADTTRVPLATLDPTRRQARVELSGTPGVRLGPPDATAALNRALDRARVVLAAEQLGIARRALGMTVDYVSLRYQFGRPIGSFQAVRHGLADVYADCELAESAVRDAAYAADHEPDRLPLAAAVAQAYVSPAAFNAAAQAIQYHGGIGYTWEHDAHLYYKRAKTDEHLLGDGGRHLDRITALLEGDR